METFLARIQQFLGRLSTGQQVGLGLLAVGTIALLVGTAYWSSQPDYALLFGDLEPEAANRVVSRLKEEGTPYELRNQGSAVYVPRASMHELRLQFSSDGTIDDGQTGYELFDQGTLGMTDFMQKLNSKRALEGELAQTVSSVGQVEGARVHLVEPEDDPFEAQQVEASASVVLSLTGGSLSQAQVQGVTQLVAGAVEKLSPSQVKVIDQDGNMLSDPNAADENVQMTSTQIDMQRSVEEQLMKQGQSMLREVVGPDNAVVRVSTELDFDRTVTEKDLVDPESATVVSEERMREEGGGDEAGNSNSVVRNFEVSRTTKRSEKSVGDVSRMTVSVVVDQERTTGPDGEPTYEPRSQEEIAKIESLVKNAVGFDEERGDRFTIQQTRLDTDAGPAGPVAGDGGGETPMRLYLRYGLILVAIGAAVWVARSLVQALTATPEEQPTPLQADESRQVEGRTADGAVEEGDGPAALQETEEEEESLVKDDMYTDKLSDEAKARLEARSEMFEEIQDQVEENPEQTADLIRSWLVEDQTM
ncbi:flagellar M-ring protein FliF [Salinibacter ruber]|uniref:flagellar basal-body MS-ring/collar protein FliF n=1 Tax=Salinibacter ruber TaxID=146919 RepID=UPI000E5964CF|nr:flagellar basal-body MS-ring/collar protein FliF [Salinibacter ruber]MCS3698861.1 flagellar M-ring protein FliF [Salinibacter ruber]